MAQYDGKILMIDDEQDLLKLSSSILRREGFAVETRSDAREALALLRDESFDIILLDLHMPEMSGLEFLRRFNVRERPEEVLILTAYAEVQSAVETIKLGAYGYLAKGPLSAEEILSHINNIRELQKLRAENEHLRQAQGAGLGMVGETEQMRQIYRLVQDVASMPLPVLICGESGTGKELVAAAIHRASDRTAGPFVRCNCAALNPGVLESELFGHVKGAFTGAVRDRKGRFMEADGGTPVPRRNRRHGGGVANPAFARVAGRGVRDGGIDQNPQGRCARPVRDQPQFDAGRGRGPVPRGFVLPPQRGHH